MKPAAVCALLLCVAVSADVHVGSLAAREAVRQILVAQAPTWIWSRFQPIWDLPDARTLFNTTRSHCDANTTLPTRALLCDVRDAHPIVLQQSGVNIGHAAQLLFPCASWLHQELLKERSRRQAHGQFHHATSDGVAKNSTPDSLSQRHSQRHSQRLSQRLLPYFWPARSTAAKHELLSPPSPPLPPPLFIVGPARLNRTPWAAAVVKSMGVLLVSATPTSAAGPAEGGCVLHCSIAAAVEAGTWAHTPAVLQKLAARVVAVGNSTHVDVAVAGGARFDATDQPSQGTSISASAFESGRAMRVGVLNRMGPSVNGSAASMSSRTWIEAERFVGLARNSSVDGTRTYAATFTMNGKTAAEQALAVHSRHASPTAHPPHPTLNRRAHTEFVHARWPARARSSSSSPPLTHYGRLCGCVPCVRGADARVGRARRAARRAECQLWLHLALHRRPRAIPTRLLHAHVPAARTPGRGGQRLPSVRVAATRWRPPPRSPRCTKGEAGCASKLCDEASAHDAS